MKLKMAVVAFLTVFAAHFSAAEKNKQTKQSSAPVVSQARSLTVENFDVSMPLRLMIPKPIVAQNKRGGLMIDPGPPQGDSPQNSPFIDDPVLQDILGPVTIPGPTVSFNALSNVSGVSPPDPAGDVGPNHYVAMTNLSFHVLSKSGVSMFGPAANNTLWTGFGGPCEAQNSGDPIVLYDQLADRWMLSQFTSSGAELFNCVALSTGPDPTGSYYRWAINNGANFPDYPKYGIWTDAYYISTRDFNGPYVGVGAYALNREDMLAGVAEPRTIYFFVDRSTDPWQVGDGLLPADIDGFDLPPAGSPQYFVGTMDAGGPYGAAQDAIAFWEFDADFDTPANSSFTRTAIIPIASYDTIFPCSPGSRDCIPQMGTTNKIDIQSYRQRALHRLAYRNFGTHESLVTNQSVESSANIGGIRWWEIRSPDNSPVVHQEGTYGPGSTDGIHRWMGSAAMDAEGNLAIAYSASSATMFPAIRYTGRLSTDPLNTLPQGEGSIHEGTGSQTNSQRWGDYTSLNVDPFDDCSFWHVNEYYDTSGGNWQIRVGAFKFNECGDPGFYFRSDDSTEQICVSEDANYSLTVGSLSNFSSPVTLSASGEPAGSVASFTPNPVASLPGQTVLTISNTASIAAGDYSIDVLGTATGADSRNFGLALKVFDQIPAVPALTSPVDMATNVDFMPSLNWTGSGGLPFTIEVSTNNTFTQIVYTGTTTGNTIVPDIALNSSTVYYWRVKSSNACGESSYSPVFSFTTAAAPGDCGPGFAPVIAFQDDFETGIDGWTSTSLVGTNDWLESMAQANSGASSLHAVDVPTTSDTTVESPQITLPTGQLPLTLQFFNRQTLELRTAGGCWDGGILEISTNNGASYTQITTDKLLTDPYDGALNGGPLNGSQAWCGDPQDWLNSVVDLTDWQGQDVRFRFRISTDGSVGREGWYLDDVKVQSCQVAVDLIFANGFEAIAPSPVK